MPAALLTAFTTHVTTDVASAPLLWVLPLSLYLLTFVLVFREQAAASRASRCCWLHLVAVAVALLALSQTKHETGSSPRRPASPCSSPRPWWPTARSTRRGPAARYLTEFYLWMSFGGALGGCPRR